MKRGGGRFFKNETWGSVLLPDIESGVPPELWPQGGSECPPPCPDCVQNVRQSVVHAVHSLQLKGTQWGR